MRASRRRMYLYIKRLRKKRLFTESLASFFHGCECCLARRRFARRFLTFANSKVGVGHAPEHNRDYTPAAVTAAARDVRLTTNLTFDFYDSTMHLSERIDNHAIPYRRTTATI